MTLGLPPFGALAVLRGPGGAGSTPRDWPPWTGSVSRPTATGGWCGPPDHVTLCDGLASVPRPAERLRVEVDPTDA